MLSFELHLCSFCWWRCRLWSVPWPARRRQDDLSLSVWQGACVLVILTTATPEQSVGKRLQWRIWSGNIRLMCGSALGYWLNVRMPNRSTFSTFAFHFCVRSFLCLRLQSAPRVDVAVYVQSTIVPSNCKFVTVKWSRGWLLVSCLVFFLWLVFGWCCSTAPSFGCVSQHPAGNLLVQRSLFVCQYKSQAGVPTAKRNFRW